MFIELWLAATWAAPPSEAEEAAGLVAACEASRRDHRPVLLEFSAPWCGDCRRLGELSQEAPLAAELRAWHHVKVDVGRFDRHADLRARYQVGAIAWWTALRPQVCEDLTSWTVLANSSFEPASGQTGPRTAVEIRDWLRSARVRAR